MVINKLRKNIQNIIKDYNIYMDLFKSGGEAINLANSETSEDKTKAELQLFPSDIQNKIN